MTQEDMPELLNSLFGRKKTTEAMPQPETEIREEKKPKFESTPIADVYAGASAQRFFNQSFHAVSEPAKAPNEKEILRGTANQMAMSGAWGTPPEKQT